MSGCCDDENFDPVAQADLAVQDEGVPLGLFSTLNFVGAGITATDAGGGVAQIEVVSTSQVFRYVAVGGEANPLAIGAAEGFVVRANANYNVQLTMGGPLANAFKDARPLVSTFTINGFDVESAVALEVGDVLMFTVEDL